MDTSNDDTITPQQLYEEFKTCQQKIKLLEEQLNDFYYEYNVLRMNYTQLKKHIADLEEKNKI